jgi:hypothetical protein
MPSLPLDQLEQKLEAAKAKLGRLKQRSFVLKKRAWQRQDNRVLQGIHGRLQKQKSS